MSTNIRRGSQNVFRDLGFGREEAENLRIRAELMAALSQVIESRGLTQVAAAKLDARCGRSRSPRYDEAA
jgi:predicted XRE-type DNA-binding protein